MHHVFNGVLISNKVDAHQASVTVGRVEGLEALAQVGLHCQASQAAAQMLNVGRRYMVMMVNTCKLFQVCPEWLKYGRQKNVMTRYCSSQLF